MVDDQPVLPVPLIDEGKPGAYGSIVPERERVDTRIDRDLPDDSTIDQYRVARVRDRPGQPQKRDEPTHQEDDEIVRAASEKDIEDEVKNNDVQRRLQHPPEVAEVGLGSLGAKVEQQLGSEYG